MTTLTDTQVITASGGLVELGYANLTANATITAAVASPALVTGLSTTVVCDGSPVMVEFFTPSLRPPATAGQEIAVNLFVDGSSYGSIANAYNPASNNDNKPAHGCYRLTPTAGSHTFDIRAGVTSGATGYINSGNNSGGAAAFIRVSKIVQATQWPAVTTGTIICTSSTRPSAPFEGQTIYETDTDLSYTYSGSAWVNTGSTKVRYTRTKYTGGNIVPGGSTSWSTFTQTALSLPASAGDVIEFCPSILVGSEAVDTGFDVVTLTGSGGSAVNSFAADGAAPANYAAHQGISGWWSRGSASTSVSGSAFRTLVAGDIVSGTVYLAMRFAGSNTTSRTFYAQAAYPLEVWARNHGAIG